MQSTTATRTRRAATATSRGRTRTGRVGSSFPPTPSPSSTRSDHIEIAPSSEPFREAAGSGSGSGRRDRRVRTEIDKDTGRRQDDDCQTKKRPLTTEANNTKDLAEYLGVREVDSSNSSKGRELGKEVRMESRAGNRKETEGMGGVLEERVRVADKVDEEVMEQIME